ncbi:MAG: hypothetical protein AVDCRST_MAG26-216 [uncultured Chloroflexia bacterium]|uniref:Uncharacterized protein n=1 Tax=uncultured Chloroflexia bacterium TaxID=1672391 RepID=A0A6J4H2Z4_9CHLR|nr:MAG: hypothetical protein AVDCRST_MAG26-216 [uncultured Chloroflexia bacterium]
MIDLLVAMRRVYCTTVTGSGTRGWTQPLQRSHLRASRDVSVEAIRRVAWPAGGGAPAHVLHRHADPTVWTAGGVKDVVNAQLDVLAWWFSKS